MAITILSDSPPMSGAELQRVRTSLGLTSAGLAELMGSPTSTITRWQKEEVAVRNPRLLRLALIGLGAVLAGKAELREPLV